MVRALSLPHPFGIRESVQDDLAPTEMLYPWAFPEEELLPLVRQVICTSFALPEFRGERVVYSGTPERWPITYISRSMPLSPWLSGALAGSGA
jgi:hypothetical protein